MNIDIRLYIHPSDNMYPICPKVNKIEVNNIATNILYLLIKIASIYFLNNSSSKNGPTNKIVIIMLMYSNLDNWDRATPSMEIGRGDPPIAITPIYTKSPMNDINRINKFDPANE